MTIKTMSEPETRMAGALEVRADGDTGRRVVGHAAVFNSIADIGGMFREQIAPGAFSRALREGQDVRALIDHEPTLILGRTTAGTLSLREDKVGLLAEFTLPDTQAARDLKVSMERGDVSQMSFAFRVIAELWEEEDQPLPLRTVRDVDLIDVSVVTFPAFEETDAAVRSLDEYRMGQIKAIEDQLYNSVNARLARMRVKFDLGLRDRA